MGGSRNSGYTSCSQPTRRSLDMVGGSRVAAVRRGASQGPALMQTLTPEPESYASFLGEKFSDQGGQQASHKLAATPGFTGKPRYRFGGALEGGCSKYSST